MFSTFLFKIVKRPRKLTIVYHSEEVVDKVSVPSPLRRR